MLRVGPGLGKEPHLPRCFLSSAHLISSRQTPGTPVRRLGPSGHIPSGVCQQPHQRNPDSGGTPGPEPLVGAQWLCGNCGLHPDSPVTRSGQVGASLQASASCFLEHRSQPVTLGNSDKAPPSPGETTFIEQNALYVPLVRGQEIIYILLFVVPE